MAIAPFGQMDAHAPQPVHSALLALTVCLTSIFPPVSLLYHAVCQSRLSAITACTVSFLPDV